MSADYIIGDHHVLHRSLGIHIYALHNLSQLAVAISHCRPAGQHPAMSIIYRIRRRDPHALHSDFCLIPVYPRCLGCPCRKHQQHSHGQQQKVFAYRRVSHFLHPLVMKIPADFTTHITFFYFRHDHLNFLFWARTKSHRETSPFHSISRSIS